MAAGIGSKGEYVLAVEFHRAFGYFIGGVSGKHIAERGFAAAVGAHQGMHFAVVYSEVNALEYFLVCHTGVKIAYL